MKEANRQAKGEQNAKAKLTEEQVIEIRQHMPIRGRVDYGKVDRLCKKYNVSRHTIYGIWRGDTWRHLFVTK